MKKLPEAKGSNSETFYKQRRGESRIVGHISDPWPLSIRYFHVSSSSSVFYYDISWCMNQFLFVVVQLQRYVGRRRFVQEFVFSFVGNCSIRAAISIRHFRCLNVEQGLYSSKLNQCCLRFTKYRLLRCCHCFKYKCDWARICTCCTKNLSTLRFTCTLGMLAATIVVDLAWKTTTTTKN